MSRFYYCSGISEFLSEDSDKILGMLTKNHEFDLNEAQRDSWRRQVKLLKNWLQEVDGTLLFEYSIPRMGKRADCVILSGGMIFVLEFKVGAVHFDGYAVDQVTDYALDLKNFHEASHSKNIVPVLICTESDSTDFCVEFSADGVASPILTNGSNLKSIISESLSIGPTDQIDVATWLGARYKPTPTIVEAAQALYEGHSVSEITRSDAGAKNLSRTARKIADIISNSRTRRKKSICFVTGVPGAGKTLVGLDLASKMRNSEAEEYAVFLSGNGPLVTVLQEALARNAPKVKSTDGAKAKKSDAKREVKSFIQNVHHFRDAYLQDENAPVDRIVVFDEAQRAWTREMTSKFMKQKKGKDDFDQSEPEFLISVMDRHDDWATVVCLIGGGQEINTGEAGLPEWLQAIERSFPDWEVHISGAILNPEYGQEIASICGNLAGRIHFDQDLHLSVSVRSFRSEDVSSLVGSLLDADAHKAKTFYEKVGENFQIAITRDLAAAKRWLKQKARGNERYGLLASSGAIRLKPFGISVKSSIDPAIWFLNEKDDVRSSYFLEDVGTEFDVQGLELDWTCVAWDSNFRFVDGEWQKKAFKGTKWQNLNQEESIKYLVNSYRVLLTRARQGMVIFVPYGDPQDKTRLPEYYDGTYEYLLSVGFQPV